MFLRFCAGRPRGLWARGERWLAHAGAVATIRVDGAGEDRFGRVRAEADSLRVKDHHADAPELAGRLRWFGGFAFGDGHVAEGPWSAFPSALFVLPELELEGDAKEWGRLRMRAPVPPGASPVAVRGGLEASLERLARDLSGGPSRNGAGADRANGRGAGRRSPSGRDLDPDLDRGRDAWERAVAQAVAAVGAGRLSKVVLARTLDLSTSRVMDVVDVVSFLWHENRGSHVFLFEPEAGVALVGAAPETVATVRRGVFHATAVAGSTRRGDSEEERLRLARALLDSAKDREEQRIVVEDMVARLRPLAGEIQVQDEPHILTLARIQHLETEIRARTGRDRHVLDLVAALHPTPAVCGVERDAALAFLHEEEPFERGWYAGPVGCFDGDGNGIFAPALRSAVTEGRRWRLFAGSGIVAGSEPLAEWEESGMKFEPVLRALQAAGADLE